MAFSKAVSLVFFLGFLFCFSSPAAEAAADFNYLNLVWPGSQCRLLWWCCVPTIGKPARDFLIEGMYPADSTTGNLVTNCDSPCRFKINALQPFIRKVNKYWSDIACPSTNGQDRWSNVWCTYGKCSGLTQRAYFNATLNLHTKLDLLFVLTDAGIVPSSTNKYRLSDIQTALQANYGLGTAVAMCNRDIPFIGTSQLYKVIFCIARDGSTEISCPTSLRTNCDANVKFPYFPKQLTGPAVEASSNPITMPADSVVAA